jgi:hypothetical protein
MPNDTKPSPSSYSGGSEASVATYTLPTEPTVVLEGATWDDSVVTWDSSLYDWGLFIDTETTSTYTNNAEVSSSFTNDSK